MKIKGLIEDFLTVKRFAFIGVSSDPRDFSRGSIFVLEGNKPTIGSSMLSKVIMARVRYIKPPHSPYTTLPLPANRRTAFNMEEFSVSCSAYSSGYPPPRSILLGRPKPLAKAHPAPGAPIVVGGTRTRTPRSPFRKSVPAA